MSEPVSNERLKAALRTAAELVALYGDEFIPTFERLESEWLSRQKNASTKARIHAFLNENEAQF